MPMETTAQRIKEALEIRNMKQTDLVEKTKIGKSSISTYISGDYEPKQKNLHKIAKALNVSEAWLMGYDVPMESKITLDKAWEMEADKFSAEMFLHECKEKPFLYYLNSLGWEREHRETTAHVDDPNYDVYFVFKKEDTAFQVSLEDYNAFLDESEDFFNARLEQLYEKSKIHLFKKVTNDMFLPQAASERTDIEVTEEMRKYDDDIMDDDNFWNK